MRSLVKIPLSSLILGLVACGGGGATGSGSPAPNPAPTPPAASTQTGLYMTQPVNASRDGALEAMNAFGDEGYAWVSDLAIPSGPNAVPVARSLYVRNLSTPTRYRYVMERGGATDVDAWLALANRHGQASWLFKGPVAFTGSSGAIEPQDLYVRRVDKTATFTWAAAVLPDTVDLVTLLELMDRQGSLGYAWRGVMQFGSTTQALFVRDNTRPGPYSYRLPAAPTTLAALSTQLSAQAQAGCRYLGPLQIGSTQSVYQCETHDPHPVSASASATVTQGGEAAMLEALNGQAPNGMFYLGDLMLGTAGQATVTVSVFSGGTQPAHPLSGPVWP